jgi:predicted ATP-grasp superfamily ATP-dependent carboligase
MDNKINARVIVTHGRSLVALRIAQSLGRRGAEIIGCDSVNMTVLSFSKFVKDHHIYASPQKNPERFIKDLKELVKQNKPIDGRPYVLMPAFYEARLIAKHKDEFDKDLIITVPDYEAFDQVDPKDNLAKTLQNFDIESPSIWFPESEDHLKSIAEKTDYPVFIKPPDEVGGRGVEKVKNASELIEHYKELKHEYPDKQILVQEAAKGVDYCFCGLFDHGKLVSSMVYINAQKFPTGSGPGSVRKTVESKKFNPIAEQLMKHVKWHGLCEIDFVWDEQEDSAPMMIEVNPRFWSGLDHSVKSNVDFPYQLYQLFVEGEVTHLTEAEIGKTTQLPGMSTLGATQAFFDEAINFDKLETAWPKIRQSLSDSEWSKAFSLFKDSMDDSFSLNRAFHTFKEMKNQIKKAEAISVPEDDPFVGLGVLFILGSLIRYGKLPPEILR